MGLFSGRMRTWQFRARPPERSEPLNLMLRFSLTSFIIIGAVALGLAGFSTRFLVNESLERDALLSAQFIQSIAVGEIRHHDLTGMKMGDVLSAVRYGMLTRGTAENRQRARLEFLDHLSNLPDLLLATIFSPDKEVIWSTNPQLVGRKLEHDSVLDSAFRSGGESVPGTTKSSLANQSNSSLGHRKCSSSRTTFPCWMIKARSWRWSRSTRSQSISSSGWSAVAG
ncbi:TPA: hypothetical protein ACNV18_002067 [Pseudomonas putida]|jgi:hypothetical protein|uniref:Uncharacterized protein n=1 Tax=Pseudomonas putida TaxID=303 RepID=A0AAW5HRM5_PSEPU|nr:MULTISPECIES: hypothetical protein [Pseudomonas]MCO1623824.1 hypothetical protein [Pseudomonas putida]